MHLDLPLRETVDEPAKDLTLDEFTKVLLRKQNNWFDRYPPHGSRPRQAPYYQPPHYQSEQRNQPALQPQGPQCYGPVLDRNGRHSTRLLTDTYRDTDLALA